MNAPQEPICVYCHMEMHPMDLGWVCVKCNSTVGKPVPLTEGA